MVESFRNALWPGYKTGAGVDPHLLAQFVPLEDALRACGIIVWPMIEFEADDALASAAAVAAADRSVAQVVICSPDKDLAQCVEGTRIVQWDRRTDQVRDAAGVHEHFGVAPAEIPDWLALVGDSADGFPGIPGWGARSAAAVLASIRVDRRDPRRWRRWSVPVRGAQRLASALTAERERADLFRTLARLRRDVRRCCPTGSTHCAGATATDRIDAVAGAIGAGEVPERLARLASERRPA